MMGGSDVLFYLCTGRGSPFAFDIGTSERIEIS